MEQFLSTETLVVELLVVIALVAVVARRLRIPYTVALVVVGLLITFQQGPQLNLTPELILTLFVPPLVFEAAFHIGLDRLRHDLVAILTLAVPGVLLTTLIVGLVVAGGVGLPISVALLFGALISATDPVAVVALFRSLNAPKRLTVLVEGESLLNDGTAIVVFNLMLGAALATAASAEGARAGQFDLLAACFDFLRVSLGGALIGIGLGWLVSQLIHRLDDYLVETTLTTILAFGSYVIAERVHVSGVLAVVCAGVMAGSFGTRGMSPTTRIVLFNFWEYLAFVANSLVFLLIGLDVNVYHIVEDVGPIAIALVAVMGSRALLAYGLTLLVSLRGRSVPRPYRHVLFWGGLRGAISLALALSLPASLPDRDLLRVMAFGVVLFTLLVEGTTMQFLLRRLGLARGDEITLEYERRRGRLMVARAVRDHVQKLTRDGVLSASTYDQLAQDLDRQVQEQVTAQLQLLREHSSLETAEREDAMRDGLRAGRAMLTTLLNDGAISDVVYEELVSEVDATLEGTAESKREIQPVSLSDTVEPRPHSN